MLGISVYFQDLDENYIRQAASLGFSYVMTSLQIPEEDNRHLQDKLLSLLALLKELNMDLIPDISVATFQKLGLLPDDFQSLKTMGLKKIRLDYGFDDLQTLRTLSKDFELVLNASVIEEKLLLEMQAAHIDLGKILAMHNYYPRKDTGLEPVAFKKKNQLLHRFGVRVQAFVCGDELKRFPLYEGLPTLEFHRTMHPLYAMIDLVKNYEVDDVFIGDSKAKLLTLETMAAYMNEHRILLPVYLENEYQTYYGKILKCRHESSPVILRITTPRQKEIAPCKNNKRYRGAITIDNILMGRYCGEMQILKEDKLADARCNIIGFVHPEYRDVLDLIDGSKTIEFRKLN